MKSWLTVKEAVPVLKMSEQTIYRVIREHQLPDAAIHRIGRRIRIDPAALSQVAITGDNVDRVDNSAEDREAGHAAR
jgi:excisionase family DNA binding protein